MKKFLTMGLLILLTGCNLSTLRWGYYWNPENIMLKAHEATMSGDIDTWRQVTQGYAYCKYGSKEGLEYIKKLIPKDLENLEVLELAQRDLPVGSMTMGFRLIDHFEYEVELQSKKSAETISLLTIECFIGEKQNICAMKNVQFPNHTPFSGNKVCDELLLK